MQNSQNVAFISKKRVKSSTSNFYTSISNVNMFVVTIHAGDASGVSKFDDFATKKGSLVLRKSSVSMCNSNLMAYHNLLL